MILYQTVLLFVLFVAVASQTSDSSAPPDVNRIVFSASSAQDYEGGGNLKVRLRYLRGLLTCETLDGVFSGTCESDTCNLRITVPANSTLQVNCALDMPTDFDLQPNSRALLRHPVEQALPVYTETCFFGGSAYPSIGGVRLNFRESATYSEVDRRCTSSLQDTRSRRFERVFQGYQDVEVDTLTDVLPHMCPTFSTEEAADFGNNWVGYVITSSNVRVGFSNVPETELVHRAFGRTFRGNSSSLILPSDVQDIRNPQTNILRRSDGAPMNIVGNGLSQALFPEGSITWRFSLQESGIVSSTTFPGTQMSFARECPDGRLINIQLSPVLSNTQLLAAEL